jgi:hypothetical protein
LGKEMPLVRVERNTQRPPPVLLASIPGVSNARKASIDVEPTTAKLPIFQKVKCSHSEINY